MNSNTFLKWMIVVGAFLSYFLADGCTYTAGILFTEFKDVFNASATATSLLPALIYAIPQFMSPFICPFTSVVGYSTAAAWGALFLCLSFIVTSFARDIILTYFAYGVLLSLGLQLTYTAAFMAVVATFKDSKWLGLACGVMVCGGGIGAFAMNHMLIWILSFWTWREALVLQGGVFLHAWISASLFYWFDERAAIKSEADKYTLYLELWHYVYVPGSPTLTSVIIYLIRDISTRDTRVVATPSDCRSLLDCVKALWYLCPIFMILTPARNRPRAQKGDYSRGTYTLTVGTQICDFCRQLRDSLACLFSRKIWTNASFIAYLLANGLAAAGVVIPWTFVYDYVRNQWLAGLDSATELSSTAETQLAWYPSLIGLGSCAGQILFGLVVSKIHNPSRQTKADNRNGDSGLVSNLTYMFSAVLLLNGAMTLGFTHAPVPSYLASSSRNKELNEMLIFSTTRGRVFAVICFFLGITDGAFMTLMGPMLEHYFDETNFPAGLGIALCFTGAFNLVGTLIGGHVFDVHGTYYYANLLAAGLPFMGFLVVGVSAIVFKCKNRGTLELEPGIDIA